MKIKELKRKLNSEIKDKYISISQPWELSKFKYLDQLEVRNIDMLYTLMADGKNWKVTIEERGTLLQLKIFENESDACEYFEKILIKK